MLLATYSGLVAVIGTGLLAVGGPGFEQQSDVDEAASPSQPSVGVGGLGGKQGARQAEPGKPERRASPTREPTAPTESRAPLL